MRRLLVLFFVLVPATAYAVPSVGGCGLGSKVFDGQSGIAPQILAVTTNGTSGNQTFGITTGTLGCKSDGLVKSNWQTAMYIDSNATKLARDMSVGSGESLEALASLLGMDKEDSQVFFAETKANFSQIFPSEDVSTGHVMISIKDILRGNDSLAQYADAI